jgi:hypothetical protein
MLFVVLKMLSPLFPGLYGMALTWNLMAQMSYSLQYGTGDKPIQPILQDAIRCFLP